MLLQVLWDTNNWDEIGYYVGRSLINSLQNTRIITRERNTTTAVIRNLSTFIKGFKTTRNQCEVTIEFSGLDNELYFKELWTFRCLGGVEAPWLLTELVVQK